RYTNEANRLYGVLDRRLAQSEHVACGQYTIADIAIMPWLRSYKRQGVEMEDYPNVKRWFDAINERPAVVRGLAVLAERRREGPMSAQARENLFGATQYQRH
ncbi:MAG: glutathione S-transferase family protein, partial [Betaproteobacteria bacterium]|nr:glutathione S-transferase family protein [Betaproteobacteria bacterium]